MHDQFEFIVHRSIDSVHVGFLCLSSVCLSLSLLPYLSFLPSGNVCQQTVVTDMCFLWLQVNTWVTRLYCKTTKEKKKHSTKVQLSLIACGYILQTHNQVMQVHRGRYTVENLANPSSDMNGHKYIQACASNTLPKQI